MFRRCWQVALSGTNQWWDIWVCTFVYIQWWFDWFLVFLLWFRFMQPRASVSTERDYVTAWLHVSCPGPCTTCVIYCWLVTSLRSLAILLFQLSVYYSTISTFMFATVCCGIPSQLAISACIPLESHLLLVRLPQVSLASADSVHSWL
jgi:hypothetical protein